MDKSKHTVSFEGDIALVDNALRDVLADIAQAHHRVLKQLTYYFVSREISEEVNTKHLGHTYPTDIITFDYSRGKGVTAELFVCPDMVIENAHEYNQTAQLEMARVVVHGLLHLVGFDDITTDQKLEMRNQEEFWLRNFSIQQK